MQHPPELEELANLIRLADILYRAGTWAMTQYRQWRTNRRGGGDTA